MRSTYSNAVYCFGSCIIITAEADQSQKERIAATAEIIEIVEIVGIAEIIETAEKVEIKIVTHRVVPPVIEDRREDLRVVVLATEDEIGHDLHHLLHIGRIIFNVVPHRRRFCKYSFDFFLFKENIDWILPIRKEN